MMNHWFWISITIASLGWYSTVTIYIAVKGFTDIRHMLGALQKINDENELAKLAAALNVTVPEAMNIGKQK